MFFVITCKSTLHAHLGFKNFNAHKKVDIKNVSLKTDFEIRIEPGELRTSSALMRIPESGLSSLQLIAGLLLGMGSLILCLSNKRSVSDNWHFVPEFLTFEKMFLKKIAPQSK